MKLFALVAGTMASVAFQMTVDAGYVRDFAWLIPWIWALSVSLWTAWMITHEKVAKQWLKTLHEKIGRGIQPVRIVLCLLVFLGVGFGLRKLLKRHDRLIAATVVQSSPSSEAKEAGQTTDAAKPPPKKTLGAKKHTTETQAAQAASTSGANSPAVGSINQGPGSIAQVGGTGNTAIIGEPEWTITKDQQTKIRDALKNLTGRFRLDRLMNSPSSYVHAGQLGWPFQKAGWKYADYDKPTLGSICMPSPSWDCQGVGITVRDKTSALAREVIDAFTSQNIPINVGEDGSIDPDLVVILAPK